MTEAEWQAERARLLGRIGGLQAALNHCRWLIRASLRETVATLPHFDMNDPQIVEKLLATTKGTK